MLTSCGTCAHQIADDARRCPMCGAQTAAADTARKDRDHVALLLLIALIVVVGLVWQHYNDTREQRKVDCRISAITRGADPAVC